MDQLSSKYVVPAECVKDLRKMVNTLSGSTILFLGGTGLIGRWFFELLGSIDADDYDSLTFVVSGRSRPTWLADQYGPVKAEFVALDFLSSASISVFEANVAPFDGIFHFAAPSAADTFAGMRGPEKYRLALSSANQLYKLVDSFSPRFLLLASSGVAVQSAGATVDEYENLAPDLFSAVESLSNGKRILERAVFELSSSHTRSAIARIFTCYGPHIPTELHYAMGNFIGQARVGRPIVVNSAGTDRRTYLYASDLICAIARLVVRLCGSSKDSFSIYNMGGQEPITIAELANKIAALVEPKPCEVRVKGGCNSIGNRARSDYIPDVTRAKEAEILIERVSLDVGLRSLLA